MKIKFTSHIYLFIYDFFLNYCDVILDKTYFGRTSLLTIIGIGRFKIGLRVYWTWLVVQRPKYYLLSTTQFYTLKNYAN